MFVCFGRVSKGPLEAFLGLLWGRRERRRRLRERPNAPQERSNGGPKRHKSPASDGGGRGLMPPFFDRRPPTLPKKPSRAPWRTPTGPQGGPPRELRCGLKHVLKYPRMARRGSPKPVISPVGIPASLRAFPGCSSKQLSWASFRNGLAGARSVNNCLKMAASKCDGPTETLLCVRACPPMPFHVPHPPPRLPSPLLAPPPSPPRAPHPPCAPLLLHVPRAASHLMQTVPGSMYATVRLLRSCYVAPPCLLYLLGS